MNSSTSNSAGAYNSITHENTDMMNDDIGDAGDGFYNLNRDDGRNTFFIEVADGIDMDDMGDVDNDATLGNEYEKELQVTHVEKDSAAIAVADGVNNDFINLTDVDKTSNKQENVEEEHDDDMRKFALRIIAANNPIPLQPDVINNIDIFGDALFYGFDWEKDFAGMEHKSKSKDAGYSSEALKTILIQLETLINNWKCDCCDSSSIQFHQQQPQRIIISINACSNIIGCMDCGKMRLVIVDAPDFFNYLVDIGGKKNNLLQSNILDISLKFRKQGNYLKPIIESGDLTQLLTVNLFQNFFTLCNIKGDGTKRETFENKIRRNKEFLPFTYDELANMKMIEGSSTQVSKKRDTMDEDICDANHHVNDCNSNRNKKARR